MKIKNKQFIFYFLICVFILSFVSCKTVHKNVKEPEIKVPGSFRMSGSDILPEKWWTVLDDENLNGLIETALSDNYNLKIVHDRLEQSRQAFAKSGADTKTKVDLKALVSEDVTMRSKGNTSSSKRLSLGVSAGYELDLWGRVSSAVEASKLDFLATKENLQVSAISLTAEVAVVWYKIVEQRGQAGLLNKQIKTGEDYLEIIKVRVRQGAASSIDVLNQEQLLESINEQKFRVESNLRLFEHQLAILLGKAPGSFEVPEGDKLPSLPKLPDTGLPSELVRKRPDIQSAYFKIRSADKKVASAVSNRYPRISLTAGIDTIESNNLKIIQDWAASLAGSLIMPLFDGNSRKAEVERTKAVLSEYVNSYGQVVITAFKEVEDALIQESMQVKRLESMNKQNKLYLKSLDLIKDKYLKGDADFLRFLTNLASYYNLERNQLAARRELVEYRINLYRALGGGWEMGTEGR